MSQGFGYRGNLVIEDGGKNMAGESTTINDVEKIIESKLEKHSEGLLTKFSEMIGKVTGKKKEDGEPKKPVKDENMVSMSEVQEMLSEKEENFNKQMNELKLQLISKDKNVTQLSEDVKKQKLESKKAQADAMCKEASLDGVPPFVINLFRPVLMSEAGDQVIKFSEEITKSDGLKETVSAEKSMVSFVQDLFKNYPNKVNMSEVTKTYLSAPSEDENKRINDRVKELMAQGKTQHEALMLAGSEVRG
jgi:hypothetical protein